MAEHDGHIELERSVDSIVVGVRHRKDPSDDIEPLMASIKRLGLLQPVTITPDGVLVCGARRLAAVKRLGWRTLKVWVRSGISDELNRLLAQQDENEQRKPLNQLEQAALFRELRRLMHEDAQRRQKATRFGADGRPPGSTVPATRRDRCRGRCRVMATVATKPPSRSPARRRTTSLRRSPPSNGSRQTAASRRHCGGSRTLSSTPSRTAETCIRPTQRIRSAQGTDRCRRHPDAHRSGHRRGGGEPRQRSAWRLLGQKRGRRGTGRPEPTTGTPGRSLRAFLLTWGDLDGWTRYYNPAEIAAQLKQPDWEMFERVLAETIAFADQVRDLRAAAPTSASA